jgi:hypothetical protein
METAKYEWKKILEVQFDDNAVDGQDSPRDKSQWLYKEPDI